MPSPKLPAVFSGAPGARHGRAGKLFSALSVALLLVVGMVLVSLTWPHTPQKPEKPAQRVAQSQTPPYPPATIPVDPPLAVARITLPPPPATTPPSDRESASRPSFAPLKPIKADPAEANPPAENVFSSLSPKPKAAVTPEVVPESPTPARFESLNPAPAKAAAVAVDTPLPAAPPSRPPGKSSEPPEEQAITENEAPVVTNVAATVAEGRALLRILEHGKGPSIEIAWPASKRQRQRLYRVLTKCYGLQPGIVDADETAYVWDARTGAIKPLDLDRTSGFVRVVSGAPVAGEVTALARMRRALGGALNATPVRTFPRRFDALLLGGLRQITGHTYAAGGSLRASYQLKNGRVQIAEIAVNGTNKPGVIDLSPVATCA